jgi:dephospho-CoA kinase
MYKVALTGGIGCGKSTVSDLFKQLAITVVDADEIAHALVAPGPSHAPNNASNLKSP